MTSTALTYESVLTYLRNAEKQIDSTLDPFDCHTNYDNISDLQIYCDALSDHMCHELTRVAYESTAAHDKTSKQSLDSICDSVVSIGSHCSHSAPHLTSCENSDKSVNSDSSLANTMSSTSSEHKTRKYSTNETPLDFCHRLSQYDNSDQIQTQLMSAKQIQLLRQHMGCNGVRLDLNHSKNTSTNTLPNSLSNPSLTRNGQKSELFGCNLDEIQVSSCGQALPAFIERCLVHLAQNAVTSVGIFRKSGVKSRITILREQSEQGLDLNLSSLCAYDLADLIKMWFRQLQPKPLLTQQIINEFRQKPKEFTLCAIPDTQRHILQIILRFLSMISEHSNSNQMTAHNLAICWTPSLCECPNPDQHLFDAQKCLEYCINNCEQLFVVCLSSYPISLTEAESELPQKHEATTLIECGPNDVLNRILFERHVFDPTVIEWAVVEEKGPNADSLLIKSQSSAFLPIKTIIIERKWRINSLNNIEVIENGHLYQSRWSLSAQKSGLTAVAHNIALDLRGQTYEWYETTFPAIHHKQLQLLQKSFLVNSCPSKESHI